jgi:hypothetical protein
LDLLGNGQVLLFTSVDENPARELSSSLVLFHSVSAETLPRQRLRRRATASTLRLELRFLFMINQLRGLPQEMVERLEKAQDQPLPAAK